MKQYFKKILFGLFFLQTSYIFCQKVLVNINCIVCEFDDSRPYDIRDWEGMALIQKEI